MCYDRQLTLLHGNYLYPKRYIAMDGSQFEQIYLFDKTVRLSSQLPYHHPSYGMVRQCGSI
jgi:hypothetical protein